MKNIYLQFLEESHINDPLALATIIGARDSTPQIPGASALFSMEGLLTGTVGGGILEADTQKRVFRALKERSSCIYEFDLKGDIVSKDEAICGGEVMILVDAHPEKHINTFLSMQQSLVGRRPGILATTIGKEANGKVSINRHWIEKTEHQKRIAESFNHLTRDQLKKILRTNTPSLQEAEPKKYFENADKAWIFLEPMHPLPHLIIAGAGHIGQVVSHLGSLLDFEVTVIDDRPEFANKEKCPDADHIFVKEFGNTMGDAPISSDTYIVIVTRGHRKDADALRACIESEAAYIGMIGSDRKIALMRKKILEEGWATPAQFDRVYAPIGIDIQSKTVQEIAISIAAQLVQVRHMKQKHETGTTWSGP